MPILRDATIPLFLAEGGAVGVIVKIGKLYEGRQKRGFLRIGVLPCIRAEEVTVRLSDSRAVTNAMQALSKTLCRTSEPQPIEIASFTLQMPEGKLHAAKLIILPGKPWSLEGITCEHACGIFRFSRVQFNPQTSQFLPLPPEDDTAPLNALFR
ncbi:MAG TPA: hypothetical protein VEH27_10000 [Methylomirabilota bacterium]|nr:hypothetical protein [Methylomirabilota bacterium]